MSVFDFICSPTYPKIYSLVYFIYIYFGFISETKTKSLSGRRKLFVGKTNRSDGQGKSDRQIDKVNYRHERQHEVSHSLRPVVLRDSRISVCSLAYWSCLHVIGDLSEVYNAPFFFKITCISRVINIDTKRMFILGNLARESVLYVVVTADLNQTICYWIATTFGDVLCLY